MAILVSTSRPSSPRLLVALLTATAVQSALAGGVTIPIVNPSFESPAIAPCGFGPPASGWAVGAVWHCGVANQCTFDAFPTGPSDGLQVGYTNSTNAPIKQVLSETLVGGETYTLRVDVGVREDQFQMQDYRIRLRAGATILVEDLGTLDPLPGTWETSVLFFQSPPNHPAIGEPLSIELVLLAGPQGNFDNVRLTKGEKSPGGPLGDLNGDGAVTATDLAILLGAWGACGSCANCPADLTGDCTVGAADLSVLLGAWTG